MEQEVGMAPCVCVCGGCLSLGACVSPCVYVLAYLRLCSFVVAVKDLGWNGISSRT